MRAQTRDDSLKTPEKSHCFIVMFGSTQQEIRSPAGLKWHGVGLWTLQCGEGGMKLVLEISFARNKILRNSATFSWGKEIYRTYNHFFFWVGLAHI